LFPSRLLIALVIPLAILGLGIWFTASAEINRGSVRVAGVLVGQPDVELTVQECYLSEGGNGRVLTVSMEAHNRGNSDVNMDPRSFHLVLTQVEDPLGNRFPPRTFTPMRCQSSCNRAPNSLALIPADARRSYTLTFWANNLPRGEEWNEYYLSLEYYDPSSALLLSKLLRPEER
jgi:hypothetical protein